jgi:hypothetical protein
MVHDPISRWENEGGAVLSAAAEADQRHADRDREKRPASPRRPDQADAVTARAQPRKHLA